jgi:hypothetical protein
MSLFARTAYRLVLRLHPRGFRAEFGDEMLWIFDEEMRCGESGGTRVLLRCTRLLADVIRSAFIQRVLREPEQPKIFAAPFGHMNSSTSLIQAGQGVFLLLSLVFSIFGIVLSGELLISGFRELFSLF